MFQPNLERLDENIRAIKDQVDEVLLVDNGSHNIDEIRNKFNDSVSIIENGSNLGVAAALNCIMEYGSSNSFDWVITLDQDSVCMPGLVDAYKRNSSLQDAGVLTCRILDRNITDNELDDEQNEDFREVKRCITSASFCSV